MNKLMPILTLAIGLGLGAWLGHQRVAPVAVAEAVPAAASTAASMRLTDHPAAVALPASPELSALRAMIREELASALAEKGHAGPRVAAPPEAPPSPELIAQRRDAQAQINALIAGGVWGIEERISLRQKLAVLDAEQRDQAMRQLVTGINNGTIKVQAGGGPPLL